MGRLSDHIVLLSIFLGFGLSLSLPHAAATPLPTIDISQSLLSPAPSDQRGETLLKQANREYNAGKYQAALKTFEAFLQHTRTTEDLAGQRIALIRIGNTYSRLGQHPQALTIFQSALQISKGLNDPAKQGSILIRLAGAYEILGQYQPALEHYQQAQQVYTQVQDQKGAAAALTGQGLIALRQGRYSQALGSYQQALALRQATGDQYGETITLTGLGVTYQAIGQYTRALETHQQALKIRRDINYLEGEASSLRYIGQVYEAFDQPRQALTYYQQALKRFKDVENLNGQERSLIRIAGIYQTLEQPRRALKHLKKALKLARQMGDSKGMGIAQAKIGEVYASLGQETKALTTYQQALALQQQIGDRAGEIMTLSHVAILFEQQGQTGLAIAFYKQAITLIESIRQDLRTLSIAEQQAFTQTVATTYRQLTDLLLSQGRIPEAQQILELLKLKELQDYTFENRSPPAALNLTTTTEAEVIPSHTNLITIGLQLAECERQRPFCPERDQLQAQRDAANDAFNRKAEALHRQLLGQQPGDPSHLNPAELSKTTAALVQAQPGTVLIYPLVLKNKLWLVWGAAAGRRGVVFQSQEIDVSQQELAQAVLEFRRLLNTPHSDLKSLQAVSQQLYGWLLEPLRDTLERNDIKNLVFSLDRVTRYIPVSALFDGQTYLLERFTISTILTAGLTDVTDRLSPNPSENPIVALGLSQPVAGFNALAHVETEIDAIVRQGDQDAQGVYPGLTFLNQAFNFEALSDHLLDRRILHIATHGKFVPGRPEDSFLLLGTGEKLEIPQIKTLEDLADIHLVVLSACETALGGPDAEGIEMAGLSYYFLTKGAKSVLASLWQVNDASTSLLMQQFYRQLAHHNTKAEALRQAQLTLIRNELNPEDAQRAGIRVVRRDPVATHLTHPYYWAPFILIGNGL